MHDERYHGSQCYLISGTLQAIALTLLVLVATTKPGPGTYLSDEAWRLRLCQLRSRGDGLFPCLFACCHARCLIWVPEANTVGIIYSDVLRCSHRIEDWDTEQVNVSGWYMTGPLIC